MPAEVYSIYTCSLLRTAAPLFSSSSRAAVPFICESSRLLLFQPRARLWVPRWAAPWKFILLTAALFRLFPRLYMYSFPLLLRVIIVVSAPKMDGIDIIGFLRLFGEFFIFSTRRWRNFWAENLRRLYIATEIYNGWEFFSIYSGLENYFLIYRI